MDALKVDAWQCGKCGLVYDYESIAAGCCEPIPCIVCGTIVPRSKHSSVCYACLKKREDEAKVDRFEKAKKLTINEYGMMEPVFTASGEFFSCLESCLDSEDFADEFVWCAKIIPFAPNAENMVESALDDHHCDAEVSDDDMAELQDFVGSWAKRQCIVSYEPDYTRAVIIGDRQGAA